MTAVRLVGGVRVTLSLAVRSGCRYGEPRRSVVGVESNSYSGAQAGIVLDVLNLGRIAASAFR